VALCVDATAWRMASSCPASGTSFCKEHPTVRMPSDVGDMAARLRCRWPCKSDAAGPWTILMLRVSGQFGTQKN
jgi:hypothetical protein